MLYIIFPQAQKQVVDWALDYRCQQGGFYRHVHLTSSFLGSLVPWVLLPSASHERPRPTDPGLSLSRFVMADRSKSRIEFVMDTCEQSLLIGPKIIILYSINRKIILAVGRMGRHQSLEKKPQSNPKNPKIQILSEMIANPQSTIFLKIEDCISNSNPQSNPQN